MLFIGEPISSINTHFEEQKIRVQFDNITIYNEKIKVY